jgi:hypothetical protein
MGKKVTKEEFVERSIKKHGDWYDYSKVVYVNNMTKVCIICPIHGEFWQTPGKHLRGQGCPNCGGTSKLTKEIFIERSIEVHGDFYDYSKVVYINANTKVCIICPIHGEFWQIPFSHLSGMGCSHCSGNGLLTKEMFIERSIEKHGEWYDYSKVEYVNNCTKVCIICPIHGEFWQTPATHMRGGDCPKCVNHHQYTTNEWVNKVNDIHKYSYDYSKTEYIDAKTKVCIIHKKCGKEFWQLPYKHLSGCGCPHCGGKVQLTKEIFIERSTEKHGEWYDYSKVEYINIHTKVCIIHKKCGKEFHQTPNSHLNGCGCPHCNRSRLENSVENFLKEKDINFIQNHKGFDWLKNIRNLELDFYLPEYNIGIECQGIQHFKPVERFGGEEQLEYIQTNDKLKLDLCKKHNLRLYYINYNDNIEEKLKEILGIINGSK